MMIVTTSSCCDIVKCGKQNNCPTKYSPEIPCWEKCFYQSNWSKVFEICKNCSFFAKHKRTTN